MSEERVVSYAGLWRILAERHINKTGLSQLADIQPNTVTKLVKGENIRVATLEKLCKALDCKIDDIIHFVPPEEEPAGPSPDFFLPTPKPKVVTDEEPEEKIAKRTYWTPTPAFAPCKELPSVVELSMRRKGAVQMAKGLTQKQIADYRQLVKDRDNGRILTPDGLRFVCSANNYDPEAIGKYFLEMLAKHQNEIRPPICGSDEDGEE